MEDGIVTKTSMLKFKDFDFAVAGDETVEESISDYESGKLYNYGIKTIFTGFDTNDLDLFADSYGGGTGIYHVIINGISKDEAIEVIFNLIRRTLARDCSFSDADILIAIML